jgi:hypothetical protein
MFIEHYTHVYIIFLRFPGRGRDNNRIVVIVLVAKEKKAKQKHVNKLQGMAGSAQL